MNLAEFRTAFLQAVGLLIKYKQTVEHMPLTSKEKPGYFRTLLPTSAPNAPESFFDIMRDLENIIIPNMLHWDHPHFYAYFACASSYPSVLAELLITGLGAVAFGSGMSPALPEVDRIALDMFGRALNLPASLLHEDSKGAGGGMFANSASEAIHTSMLVARNTALKMLQAKNNSKKLFDNIHLLVAYCSKQAHSSVEKAAFLLQVEIRLMDVIEPDFAMDLEKLEEVMNKDKADGRHPFFVLTCFGSTGTAAMDDLEKLQHFLQKWPDVWYHFDGAYGGAALIIDEYKYLTQYITGVDSMNVNGYKWALSGPCGSCLWVKNRKLFEQTLTPQSMKYFKSDKTLNTGLDVQSITLTRKMRGFKLYTTLRSYGKKGLQRYIKNHMILAKRFEQYIVKDPLFIQVGRVYFSLVCFRMTEIAGATSDQLTKELISRLNDSRKIHLTPSAEAVFFIRFCVVFEEATKELIDEAYKMIRTEAENILADRNFKSYPPMSSFLRQSNADNRRRSIDFDSVVITPPRRKG